MMDIAELNPRETLIMHAERRRQVAFQIADILRTSGDLMTGLHMMQANNLTAREAQRLGIAGDDLAALQSAQAFGEILPA